MSYISRINVSSVCQRNVRHWTVDIPSLHIRIDARNTAGNRGKYSDVHFMSIQFYIWIVPHKCVLVCDVYINDPQTLSWQFMVRFREESIQLVCGFIAFKWQMFLFRPPLWGDHLTSQVNQHKKLNVNTFLKQGLFSGGWFRRH